MLLTKNLIKDVEEKYIPMLKMVNIPDFTKCIAQFSGLPIDRVPDNVIKDYLITWAINKYRFFEMLGNKIQLDIPFEYNHLKDDIQNELKDISRVYPVYSYWLDEFRNSRTNKISSIWDFDFRFRDKVNDLFPQYKMSGSTITHFFKGCLNAPDDLVTRLAAIFENQKVKATYTISIDPVDMMLASENPYNWTSCYRLELEREDSHADGCLAAILDTTSIISYVWNNEGKFNLYENYQFKNIRYKRMRQWLAISKNMTSIHFNMIYPGKSSYEESFEKQLRCMVEATIAKHLGVEDKWKRCNDEDCYREYEYGYSEYDRDNIWVQKDAEPEEIIVFNKEITCPCGCGNILPGSHSDYDEEYNGCGFTRENYEERYWCDLADDYCCSCGEDCENCSYWQNEHPICDIDQNEEYECPQPDSYYIDDGIMESCSENCRDCPRWKEHHPEEAVTAEKEDAEKENTSTEEGLVTTLNTTGPYASISINENPNNIRYTLATTNWQSVSTIDSVLETTFRDAIANAIDNSNITRVATTDDTINWSATTIDDIARQIVRNINNNNN